MAVSYAIVSVMGPLQLSLSSGKVSMVRVSVLNDALKSMYNAEKRGKRHVMIRPSSKVIIKFLTVMQRHG
jgi:small subunit ribosomal protein S15Ae